MLASCIEPAAPNIRHCVDFVGCVVGDCDAVHIGCVHDSVLSLVLVTEGLTLLLCLTASGLFSRTCLTARPAPSVVSDAKGHLTAVITIRHHIYFAHLFFPFAWLLSSISYTYRIPHVPIAYKRILRNSRKFLWLLLRLQDSTFCEPCQSLGKWLPIRNRNPVSGIRCPYAWRQPCCMSIDRICSDLQSNRCLWSSLACFCPLLLVTVLYFLYIYYRLFGGPCLHNS